jgi:hypothetical protein
VSDFGKFVVKIKVEDEEPLALDYQFNLHVSNNPPVQLYLIND